jgi:hypothetical protein
MKRVLIVLVLLLACQVLAQESANYQLTEYAFNAGGVPTGEVPSSARFQITLASTGQNTAEVALSSTSFTMAAGFGSSYPPPGEVSGVVFGDKQTLQWDTEGSVGVYNLYRALMSNLLGLGFGNCEQQDLSDETATDNDPVPTNDGFFYLVTAENLLSEEGTKGSTSAGLERSNAQPCP